MVLVSVKWGGSKYDNVQFDLSKPLADFKSQLSSLTSLDPSRQKILVRGKMLKENENLSNLQISDGQVIMLMGSVQAISDSALEELKKSATSSTIHSEKDEDKIMVPCGLDNLGNTCYFNATLQCLYFIPELRSALIEFCNRIGPDIVKNPNFDPTKKFVAAIGLAFLGMKEKAVLKPQALVNMLRQQFPQFDQKSDSSSILYAQQDAEECYSVLINTFEHILKEEQPDKAGILNNLFVGEFKTITTCEDSPDEVPTVATEPFLKLNCHISQSTSHLLSGLKEAMETKFEMNSASLNRSAHFVKKFKISKLPSYLAVNFIRFFWKRNEGVKAKILKKVSFPLILDVFSLCDEEYQKRLKEPRENYNKKEDQSDSKLKKITESSGNPDIKSDLSASKNNFEDPTISKESSEIPTGMTGYYELIAVLTHMGRTADVGHYEGWVRDEKKKDLWWHLDDDVVSQSTERDILKLDGGGEAASAYLCFYKAIFA